ncbi:MAG: ribosome maturation factor RimP [Oscillospiraceae bacterium]|nr:ribosome maturation factor RimP [Oscillospiraceae bacterium]MDD4367507.1 ribosome maturation factor RimP [Oscillospiraceae bacterium]
MAAGGRLAREADNLARPIIEQLGYELIDTDFLTEAGRKILRFYIDRRGGVGLTDCETVSRAVDPLLDTDFSFPGAYYLEVSSPGVERPLKTAADFKRHKDELVEVSLYKAVDGVKRFTATLLDGGDDWVRVMTGQGVDRRFALADVAKIKRIIVF